MASTGSRRGRPPRRRGRSTKSALSEAAVVDAGLRVLARSGLEAVTMRAVAQELDTGAASLYVYVGGRDELCRLMFDRVAGLVDWPTTNPDRWREQLRTACLDMLVALEAHPGIARVAMGTPPMGPNAMDGAESIVALLLAGGADPQRAAFASDALFLLVVASAIETNIMQERADPEHQSSEGRSFDIEPIREMFRNLPQDRYPNLVAHHQELTAGLDRERFLFAIDTFIAGVVAGNA